MKRIGILGTTILFAIFGFAVRMQAQDQHDKDAAPEKHEEAKPAEHQDDKAPKPEKQDAKPQEQPKPEKQDAKPQEQRHDDDKAAKQDEHQQDQQKNAGKANKDQQKDQEKAAKDQQKQAEKQQKDQQKQAEQQQKAAQHDQKNDKDQKRDDQRMNGQQPVQQANRPSPQPQHGNAGVQQSTWQEHRASNWKSEHRDWQQRGGYHGYRIPDDRFRASFGEAHRFRIDSVPVTVVEGFPRFQIDGFWFAMVDPWPEYWSNNWYDTDDVYIEYYDGGYYLNDPRYPGVRLAINVYVG